MRFVIQSSLLGCLLATAGCTAFFEEPSTPLGQAALMGDLAAIASLAGPSTINEYDASGNTALHWAARGGHPAGPHQCGGEDPAWTAVVNALLDAGANPDLPDRRPWFPGSSSGWTPLLEALHHEQFGLARLLLDRGADPGIRSDQGRTSLEMAAAEGAPPELLERLIGR